MREVIAGKLALGGCWTRSVSSFLVAPGSETRLIIQKNSGRLWRSQRRKSRSVPEGGADFPAAVFLAGKCPKTLAGIAYRAAGKSVKNFPAASNFAGKLFTQGISDSHSLLKFSEIR